MKRLALYVSGVLTSIIVGVCLAAYTPKLPPPYSDVPQTKKQQFQMNGTWLPNVDPIYVGSKNYTEVKNLRPTDSGYETVEGFSKINTTATDPAVDMHFFKRGYGNSEESHVIAKLYDSDALFTYSLWDNNATIPAQGDFESSSMVAVGCDDEGSFSDGPQGTLFYTDSGTDLVYGGDKRRANAVYVSDSSEGYNSKEYTDSVNNDSTASTAPIGSGGIDSNTVLMLHCDGTDASTTFTDSSPTTPHTVTANGDAQIDTSYYKFLTGSGLFDGTGDYLSIPDNDDFYFNGDFTIDLWFKFNSLPTSSKRAVLYSQYVDSDNYVALSVEYAYGFNYLSFTVRDTGTTTIALSLNMPTKTDVWYHVAVCRGYDGTSDSWLIQEYDSSTGLINYDTVDDSDSIDNLAGSVYIGGMASYPSPYEALNGAIDELRVSRGTARYSGTFTPPSVAYTSGGRYLFVLSPLLLDGIHPYIDSPNTETTTLAGAVWTGSAYSTLTLSDGTSSGGISFAQSGDITWSLLNNEKVKYFNGNALYVYRFDLNGGTATINSLTVSAPFQSIKDVWNGSERTCISFQAVRSDAYEDYTYQVSAKDSAEGGVYAATIGGLGSSDEIIMVFEDKTMAVNFGMFSSLVNAADAQIDSVSYWDGDSYETVGWFNDGTLNDDGNVSFFKSGVLSWSPLPNNAEQKQDIFGVSGYAYKLTVDGTLTDGTGHDGTSIDFVGGITSPLNMSGFSHVGTYNGRVFLFDGAKAQFSQADTPWVFNGVDTSDNNKRPIQFGDDDPVKATATIYNRYGSSLIETFLVIKSNSTYIMSGSQPYVAYEEPFVKKKVSDNIGIAAPRTLNSYEMEVSDGIRMSVAVWLDFSGPIIFNGAVPTRIPGVENFFDPTKDECVNYTYISKAVGYIDSIHDEWNLMFPSGSDATSNNKWIVYSFKQHKWFEKKAYEYADVDWDSSGDCVQWDSSGDCVTWPVPTIPTAVTYVTDQYGARYNYGFLDSGYMMRLDHTQEWDDVPIYQRIKTGIFSPPVDDDMGFWTTSTLRGYRLISKAIDEDTDVTVKFYVDGVESTSTITIPLDSGGVLSRNLRAQDNVHENGEYYQIEISTTTDTDKWAPLSQGFVYNYKRHD